MNRLLIWGCGGHAKVVLDIARAAGVSDDFLFIDDSAPAEFMGYAVVGTRVRLPHLAAQALSFVVAIGGNAIRAECYEECRRHGLSALALVHPSAVVSPSARIGPGTVVMPRAVVNAAAEIGENCIINTGAVVEHDCLIGDHVHVSPGAVLGGGVKVGARVHVGMNAAILPGIEVGERAVVGAGAVVIKAVPAGITVVGVPARPIR